MDLDYDELFKISIWALKINRSYPTIPNDKIWYITMIPMHGLFFVEFCLLLNSTICHDLKNDNFSAACTNGIFAVLFNCVTFKYTMLFIKKQDIITAINKIKGDYESAKHLPVEEQEIVVQYAKIANWVTKVWFMTSCVSFSVFPVVTIVQTVNYCWIGEPKLVYLYDMTYPEAIETRKGDVPVYLFLMFLQIYYALYTVLMYVGFTPLGLIFMLHTCGQLEIVKYRIRNLFNGDHYDPREIRERLKNIVMPLQDVLEYVDLLKETFRVIYEMYMKATTIVLPIAFYEIVESFKEGQASFEFMTIIVASVVLCFAPCYYSDLLMEKGESVRLSVYTSGWESHPDISMRRTLLITLSRLERDVAIRTLFRTVNLDAFAELCHQSYALFSVINAAWN
uniref:Odorant receptor n=1 Tax=Epiphyas postvittana TaxID=65032 RepID=A0A0K8TUR7_EPIPO